MAKSIVQLSTQQKVIWLCISVLFLLTPLLFFANYKPFYLTRFEKYDVYSQFPQSSVDEITARFSEVVFYLSPFGQGLDKEFFSREDVLHMQDVKKIMTFFYLLLGSILLLLTVKRDLLKKREFYIQSMKYSGGYIFLSLCMLFIISLNFDYFFTKAHELVFSNDFWLLDPITSNLIKLFPQQIFFELFEAVVITNLLFHLSFIMIGLYYRYEKRQQ